MVRLCGAALGLLAFSVTILLGLAAGNPAEATLLRAVWAMLVFCVIGLSTGWVGQRVVDEHALLRHREKFRGLDPLTGEGAADSAASGAEEASPAAGRQRGAAAAGHAAGQ